LDTAGNLRAGPFRYVDPRILLVVLLGRPHARRAGCRAVILARLGNSVTTFHFCTLDGACDGGVAEQVSGSQCGHRSGNHQTAVFHVSFLSWFVHITTQGRREKSKAPYIRGRSSLDSTVNYNYMLIKEKITSGGLPNVGQKKLTVGCRDIQRIAAANGRQESPIACSRQVRYCDSSGGRPLRPAVHNIVPRQSMARCCAVCSSPVFVHSR